MTWIAAGVTAAIAVGQAIGGAVSKRKAKKAGAKAEKEITAKTEAQKKELAKGVKIQQGSEMDLAREFEGQAGISPETAYARNQSERATASAIDKATRTGSSTSEIMNMVSGLTAKGQMAGERLSAAESERRGKLRVLSKSQAINAARTGLAGKEAMIGLEDKAYNMTMQKQGQINQAAAQNFDFFSGALGDLGSAYLYGDMMKKGGGGASTTNKGTDYSWGTVDNYVNTNPSFATKKYGQ